MPRALRLPAELETARLEIESYARGYGLDFFPTIFEMVDLPQMSEVASYSGFPKRYPHWRFGMNFEEMDLSTTYGLSRIYELVINTNPCYAYLLTSNNLVEQKMVIAHVLGHSDFFKNNQWFAHTNRKMLDEMANHAARVQRYMDRYGQEEVESFIDACLSLENLLDIHAPFIRRTDPVEDAAGAEEEKGEVPRLRSKDYMDPFINPDSFLDAQRRQQRERREALSRIPARPVKDVPGFFLDYAPLDVWEWDILSMVREEALYFAPQKQTKIMNEGWATYWHSRIMTERALGDGEILDYAERHAGTVGMQPGVLNPYKLGLELFRDIEDRWDRGACGPEWESCTDMRERDTWDRRTGEGRAKIYEVRRVHNDVTFVDTFLTEDFCRRRKLFTYRYDEEGNLQKIDSRDFEEIKRRMLFSLTNFGDPFIYVEDANHHNRGELLLRHQHEGHDLRLDYARDTLARVHRFWRRPVNLLTVIDEEEKCLRFDGDTWTEEELAQG